MIIQQVEPLSIQGMYKITSDDNSVFFIREEYLKEILLNLLPNRTFCDIIIQLDMRRSERLLWSSQVIFAEYVRLIGRNRS